MATPIILPRQGQSVESCILNEWLVKAGDTVEEGQAIASVETDKATFEVEAPEAGTILDLFFEEGDDIPVLLTIAAVGPAGEDASGLKPDGASSPAAAPEEADPGEPTPTAPAPEPAAAAPVDATPGTGISPRARNTAVAKGVNPATLQGTGPGGRIIERDVLAAQTSPLTPAAKARAASEGLTAPAEGSGIGGRVLAADLQAASVAPALESREVPVKGIRKIIADRMYQSLSSTAQLTLHRSFDASAILAYRAKVKQHGEALGIPSITINDLIVYATAQTLKRHPELNAHFLGDKILQPSQVNMGIAVDTERGLMVPVVRGVESLSLAGIASSVRPLAEACIAGNINPDHLSGGTFTITNLGALGVETFTPVLNTPEVAILGVGGLRVKPVRTADGVDHVDAIDLSLTINHQAVDGAPAARFLKALAEALEHIELLLAN